MSSATSGGADELVSALASIQTESDTRLLMLVEESPVLLIFLRHFGCSFCRQAISDVADLRDELERRRVRPVFVHLGPPELAKVYFEYYRIGDVERVNDPSASIYELPIFALGKKSPLMQALNPRVMFGWLKGTIFKHGIGRIEGNGHQMPGLFFLKDGKIARRFIYKTIADEPDYLKLVR